MLPLFILTIEDPEQRTVFARLYTLYESFMYQLAYTFVKSADDAEDAVHQVFLKLIENGASLNPDDTRVKAYLAVCVKNAALNILRAKKHIEPDSEGIITSMESLPQNQFSAENFDLVQAISKLPEKYEEAVILYYYEGYKIKEIASILGESSSAVQKRLERARHTVEEYIKEDRI